MRMFLTRLGNDSRAVVTGDVTQVDLPERANEAVSAEAPAAHQGHIEAGRLQCTFTDVDVVRHPLVQKIIVAYEQRDLRDARPGGKTGPQIFPRPAEPATKAARTGKRSERKGRRMTEGPP